MHNKKNKKEILKSNDEEIDFETLTKSVGFVKARQMLKQRAVKFHQIKINKSDHNVMEAKRPNRLEEAIRISSTLGSISLTNPIDKVIEASSRPVTRNTNETAEEAQRNFDTDTSIRRCMSTVLGELLLPQMQLEHLPNGLGDTLFLQTAYLKRLSCPRNNLMTLLSIKLPQLSIIHLRYIQELNLTTNKLITLPSEIGIMKNLKILLLSDNNLSKFPNSFTQLSSLIELDLSRNMFSNIPYEFTILSQLEKLNLSNNIFISMQYGVALLKKLKYLDLSNNQLTHLAIQPPLLKPDALWEFILDAEHGKFVYRNILTREKTKNIHNCTTKSIEDDPTFHVYHNINRAPILYRRRKIWLSICQVNEWDTAYDESTGLVYYRNNVSGETQWEMPSTLDLIYRLESLETLKLNENVITTLPKSLLLLTNLHILLLSRNKIRELLPNFGLLTSLHKLVLNSCELKLLPASLVDCSNLVELNVENNQIVRLPDLLGTMVSIGKINAAANRLKQLPFTIGYSKTLSTLTVQENPLVDPPMEEVEKGLNSLKWYLRQRLLIEKRGYPPPMKFQSISIKEEVTMIHPEFVDRLKFLSDICIKTGLLNLQLLGLKEIPKELFKLRKNIKRLRLDFNQNLTLISGTPIELSYCKVLSIRSCHIPSLPDNIINLKRMHTLNCQDNYIENLPSSFINIKTLTHLDLSKNKIYLLPENFENLKNLKHLNLEGNNLEELPYTIGKLKKLHILNVSRNRIRDLPYTIYKCKYLKKLNVEINRLTKIPEQLSETNIVELRIGHNFIDYLPDDLFDKSLGKSCKLFSCSENNLMELPTSLCNLDSSGLFDADYNPLISPPTFLLSQKLSVIIQYMHIRQQRLDEFADLLEDEDFTFVVENSGPIACETLTDGTGFLTPLDLIEFDQAVHEFLNGEYYRCPSSAEEIVANISKLRDFREAALYSAILNTFINVLNDIMKSSATRKLYSDAVIQKGEKPWGRKGEPCSVFIVALSALLRDAPPNYYQKQGRPSIINLVQNALPPMPFPFTVELFKDSLRLFVSPYGQVADTIQHTFPKCDCIDDIKGKPMRHSPCIKPAVCIVTSIYTDEEASRRDIEEDEYIARFEEIENEIRAWSLIQEGRVLTDLFVSKCKELIRDEYTIKKNIFDAENIKLKNAKAELQSLTTRKQQFDDKQDFSVHRFLSIEQAIELIQVEKDKIEKHTDKTLYISGQLNILKTKLAIEQPAWRKQVLEDLIQKYCAKDYFDRIKKFRIYAIKNKLRRPWDGLDGILFEGWRTRLLGSTSTADMSLDDLINEETVKESENQKKALENELNKLKPDEIPPEYNYDGCDKMSQFDFLLWFRYIKMRSSFMSILSNVVK